MFKSSILSVPGWAVPSGVIKNKEALFFPECNQILYVTAAVIPALWLSAIMAAGANPGSGKTSIPGRGGHLAQPARLALDSWFKHLADGYESWWSLVSRHYFSVAGIMVLPIVGNCLIFLFLSSSAIDETDFLRFIVCWPDLC